METAQKSFQLGVKYMKAREGSDTTSMDKHFHQKMQSFQTLGQKNKVKHKNEMTNLKCHFGKSIPLTESAPRFWHPSMNHTCQ